MSDGRRQFGLEGDEGVTGDAHRADAVSLRVQRVAWGVSMMERLRAIGERLWVLGPVALALVGLDAALALPAWARVALGAVAVVLGLRVLVGIAWPGRAVRMTAMRAARMIEQRLGLRDNAIVNALQLRTALVSGDRLAATLAERAVDHGVEVAQRTEGTRLVDGRSAARAWGMVLGAALLLGASAVIMPRVWAAGVARYVDPFGSHAPWSPTVFSLDISPRDVLAGDDVQVVVNLSGAIPQSVGLVFLDKAGAPIDRAPMGAVFDHHVSMQVAETAHARRYELTLHDLREPVRFYPESETGRGELVEIVPLDKPRLESATLVVRPPSYTRMPATTQRVDLGSGSPQRVLQGSEAELTALATVQLGDIDHTASTVTGEIDILGTAARQRVMLDQAGEQTLSLRPVSRSGLRADKAARITLNVVEDTPPRVLVRAPAGEGERAAVLVGRAVPVRAIAEDDVRVEGLDVEWRVTRLGETAAAAQGRADLSARRPMRTRWQGELTLDTTALSAEAGDTIELWVEGRDGRGEDFGGPQVTRVGPIRVEVIDEAEFRRRSLAQMGIDDVVGPYEQIAKEAQELAALGRESAEASERASGGDAGAQEEARRASEAVQAKRDELAREIRKRLGNQAIVDFDEAMRGSLEKLLDRLEGFEQTDAEEFDGHSNAERAQRNAERLDLAAREATMGLEKPSERLRLAAKMRRELERLDRIAKSQRALSDRLGKMPALSKEDAAELASEQLQLMAEADRVCTSLDALGDAAANELPNAQVIVDRARQLTEARRTAQESIEAARNIADEPAQSVSDVLIRDSMREAADLALTDLYFSTDPTLHAVEEFGDLVENGASRIDEPGVGDAAQDVQDEIDRALNAVQQIKDLLEQARERVRSYTIRSTAQANPALPPLAMIVVQALGAVDEERVPGADSPDEIDLESGTIDERFVRALELAHVRLGALGISLQEARESVGPCLPVMGQSAIDLARRVDDAEIAGLMYDSQWALSETDLAAARERANLAAERLEALYEQTSGGEGQCDATDDTPLRLINADPSQGQGSKSGQGEQSSSSATSGTTSGSAPAGGQASGSLPNALDVLAQSSAPSAQRSGAQSGSDAGDDDPTDRGGFKRAGALPGAGDEDSGTQGQGDQSSDATGAPGEGKGESGAGQGDTDNSRPDPNGTGDPNLADRARRFNERLYSDPIQIDRPVEGESDESGGRIDADAIRLEGDPIGRERLVPGLLARSGMDAAQVEAVFERVPAAYRDVVAAYLLRIAKDEAAANAGEPRETE